MKCGYCGWIMPDDLSELNKHKCFETYNDEVDIIVVDDNKVVTMSMCILYPQEYYYNNWYMIILQILEKQQRSSNSSIAAVLQNWVQTVAWQPYQQIQSMDYSSRLSSRKGLCGTIHKDTKTRQSWKLMPCGQRFPT